MPPCCQSLACLPTSSPSTSSWYWQYGCTPRPLLATLPPAPPTWPTASCCVSPYTPPPTPLLPLISNSTFNPRIQLNLFSTLTLPPPAFTLSFPPDSAPAAAHLSPLLHIYKHTRRSPLLPTPPPPVHLHKPLPIPCCHPHHRSDLSHPANPLAVGHRCVPSRDGALAKHTTSACTLMC